MMDTLTMEDLPVPLEQKKRKSQKVKAYNVFVCVMRKKGERDMRKISDYWNWRDEFGDDESDLRDAQLVDHKMFEKYADLINDGLVKDKTHFYETLATVCEGEWVRPLQEQVKVLHL